MWTCYSSFGSIIPLFCKKDNQLPYIYELFWMSGKIRRAFQCYFFSLSFECYCFFVSKPSFFVKFSLLPPLTGWWRRKFDGARGRIQLVNVKAKESLRRVILQVISRRRRCPLAVDYKTHTCARARECVRTNKKIIEKKIIGFSVVLLRQQRMKKEIHGFIQCFS